jgi:hypothetical protein
VPVARYFVRVGGALAALMLIVSWYCPAPPETFADRPQIIAAAAIRIRSERKWPEKIEFDTSLPMTMMPPPYEASPVIAAAPGPPEDTAGKPSREALAQLSHDTRLAAMQHQAAHAKRKPARPTRSSRVARVPTANRLAGLDTVGCCQFGWRNNWQARPNAVPRKRATPVSTGWLAF